MIEPAAHRATAVPCRKGGSGQLTMRKGPRLLRPALRPVVFRYTLAGDFRSATSNGRCGRFPFRNRAQAQIHFDGRKERAR
jgi:hypothetical protein